MEYNLFGFKVTARITLIIANSLLFAFIILSIPEKQVIIIPFILSAILIFQIWELNRYINLTNREIVRFIDSIKSGDLSLKFSKKHLNGSFTMLFTELQGLLNEIKNEKHQKQAISFYQNEIIKHLVFGLITVNEDGDVTLINEPASNLLGKRSIVKLKDIEETNPTIAKEINSLLPKGEKLIEINDNSAIHRLLLSVSTIVVLGKKNLIVSFQDIGKEIDQKEVETWIKLIRVIRHEIMNSITPISSMSETIAMVLEGPNGIPKSLEELTNEDINDLHSSAKTIRHRTEGIYKFVDKYWDISKIPHLKISRFKVSELINSVYNLMLPGAKQNGVNLTVDYENNDLEIDADILLLEQVLINLLKNSFDALKGSNSGMIRIKSYVFNSKVIIEVIDNGQGIPTEIIDEIFVPFFSTKVDGSGIGLSLSKQIMNIHGGSITAFSKPNDETIFRLTI